MIASRNFVDGVVRMKRAERFFMFWVIGLFLFGCEDQLAGVEGKIADGQGKPLSGITVVFTPTAPVKGYEHFETKTGADGSFRLTGLAPSSEYMVSPLAVPWNTRLTRKIKTREAGQNLALDAPIKIRFIQMKDGTVIDTRTSLQWLIYPVADMTAANVLDTVKGLKERGFADWRLPSRSEMAGLRENPAAINKKCCVWVAEPQSDVVEWAIYSEENNDLWMSGKAQPENRIVVVRPASPSAPAAPAPRP